MTEANPTIQIVGVMVLGDDNKLAMMGRRSRDPKLPEGVDTYTSIGGGWKQHRETMVAGAVREIKEEAGVAVDEADVHHVASYNVVLEENGADAVLHILFYDAQKAGNASQFESQENLNDVFPAARVPMKWVDEAEYNLMAAKSVAAVAGQVFTGHRLLLPNQIAVTDAIAKLKERGLMDCALFNTPAEVFADPAAVIAALEPVVAARMAKTVEVPVIEEAPVHAERTVAKQAAPTARRGFSLRSALVGLAVGLVAGGLAGPSVAKMFGVAPVMAPVTALPTFVPPVLPAASPVSRCAHTDLALDFGALNDGLATIVEGGEAHTIRWAPITDGGIAPDARSLVGLSDDAASLASVAASNRNLLMVTPGRPRGAALTPALQEAAAKARVAICG